MFWRFLNFFILVENIVPTWANNGINWQKFSARITKWVFASNAPNTLQYVQKSCFAAFRTFSFRSKTSHPCLPIMPILALIDKRSSRESRRDFFSRTHPIHSNMSKNHVLLLFELFNSGLKHCTHVCQYWHSLRCKTSHPRVPIYANIDIIWQKLATRITKCVFAMNTPDTLQFVQK